MSVPFFDLFHKLRARFFPAEPPANFSGPTSVRVTKTSGDRRSKTVLPRPVSPREPVTAAKAYGQIPRGRELPPALAKALEPKLERAISLQLSDFLDSIPAEYVKPVEVIDANRTVTLKASEVEKGMCDRQPSISLPSLYQQIPEIFLRSVAPADETRVLLPYEKVLEQFNRVQVRRDQQRDDRVPQLETPILQATIEDTERFGTKMEPLEGCALPPVPIEPATAETIASAEPEPAIKEIVVAGKTSQSGQRRPVISLSTATVKPAKEPAPVNFKTAAPPPPLKIPFQFPPNGTGAPASERVPASCGPPVPPLSNPPLKLESEAQSEDLEKETPKKKEKQKEADPAKFPKAPEVPQLLKLAPSPEPELQPLVFGRQVQAPLEEIARTAAPPVEDEAPSITLALKPILNNLPMLQRAGDFADVPDAARVKFPLELVQTQLASGRVLIPAKVFQSALPPAHRELFAVDPGETPVSLPLPEVLKNLPSDALKLRQDQQKFFAEEEIATPISLKAKEDATRFPLPVTETAKAPAPIENKEAAVEAKVEPAPAKEKLDGKQVVDAACKLPGVAACELVFPDGLGLAGNFPADIAADGLCAMAPTLLQRIEAHILETKLGRLSAMTLHATSSAITFFMTENICLAALHKDATALPNDTRAKLNSLTEELSRNFTPPEKPHVDH